MPNSSKLSPRNKLYFLTFFHYVVDSYATVLPHLLPLLLNKLVSQTASRNSRAGDLISASFTFSALGQILFGWLSDRVKTIHFLTFGIALPAVCMSLIGVAPSFFLLILLLIFGGLGVAAFHPQGTTQAAALSKQSRGLGVSFFLTGGNIGRALGPLFIVYLLVYRHGLASMVWCMPFGLLSALLAPKVLKTARVETTLSSQTVIAAPSLPEKRKNLWQVMRPNFRTLLVLYLIAVLRTVTTVGLENFGLSLYLSDQQYSNFARSAVIALFLFAGSMGIMAGGWISDRVAHYRLLIFSLLVAPPLLYASLHSTGALFPVLLFIGNFVLSTSITVNIVLAQQLLPGHENIASSIMMGGAWGVGGLLNKPVGMLSDRFGIPTVLNGLVTLPLAAAVLMIFLKRDQK